jgi:hypothetical protein
MAFTPAVLSQLPNFKFMSSYLAGILLDANILHLKPKWISATAHNCALRSPAEGKEWGLRLSSLFWPDCTTFVPTAVSQVS